jgi:ketosteroid isomerase-like protein
MTSPNKRLIEALESSDRSKMNELLAPDVEWVEWVDGVPAAGAVRRGKDAYLENYGDDQLQGHIIRLVEEGNVVVAEGTVRVNKKDGSVLNVRYCDIYEIEHGKIKRKSSYGALLKDAE